MITCLIVDTLVEKTPAIASGCGSRLSSRLGQVLDGGVALDGGRYVVQRLLGQGGNGAVYLADDNRLGRVCVVKELLGYFSTTEEKKRAEQDFRREALMLARLSTEHGGLPQTYDYFSDGDRYYLVMQYIAGRNLEQMLKESGGLLPANEVIELASSIAEVLIFLHNQPEPVIHRDVKPANIIVDPQGRVKLVDFGLAKALSQPVGAPLSTVMRLNTSAAGTAGYTPLEQWMLQPEPRSDVFALGATMHQLLTGRDPRDEFPSRKLDIDLLRRYSAFPSLRSLKPELAPEFETLVGHMLADNPAQRPSALEVKEALALLRRRSAARRTGRWTAPPAPAPEELFSFPLVPKDEMVREVRGWFSTSISGMLPQDNVEVVGADVEMAPYALFDYKVEARFENGSGALIGNIDENGAMLLDGVSGQSARPATRLFLISRRSQLVPFALPQDVAPEAPKVQPSKQNETRLSDTATGQLVTQYTRRIRYTAANGREYERLCKPLQKQVELSNYTRLYVPVWTVRIKLRGREYHFEAFQATATPADGQVLFVRSSNLPGAALCATCGSLNSKDAMIRCQHCNKLTCPRCVVQRSRLGIFHKQFCSITCAELFNNSRSMLSWL